jgi:hypothetical protein
MPLLPTLLSTASAVDPCIHALVNLSTLVASDDTVTSSSFIVASSENLPIAYPFPPFLVLSDLCLAGVASLVCCLLDLPATDCFAPLLYTTHDTIFYKDPSGLLSQDTQFAWDAWLIAAFTPTTHEDNLLDDSCGRIFLDTIPTILLLAALLFVVAAGTTDCCYAFRSSPSCEWMLTFRTTNMLATLLLLDSPIYHDLHAPEYSVGIVTSHLIVASFLFLCLYVHASHDLLLLFCAAAALVTALTNKFFGTLNTKHTALADAASPFFLVHSILTNFVGF